MAGKHEIEATALRPLAFYETHRIELVTDARVTEIDRLSQSLTLATGRRIPYDALVLAVGASNRPLPVSGAELEGVCYLRTDREAIEIRQRIRSARDIIVIGGGFIGLELAAAARGMGKSVRVLEVQTRLMARAMPPILSEFYRDVHSAEGVDISLAVSISKMNGHRGRVTEVVLDNGATYPADLVLVGIGVVPNVELARVAGLSVANGITVDEHLATQDPSIYAIGDCADHPNPFAANPFAAPQGARVRLESVQNAVDQAKSVAAAILGRAETYRAVPWFWTDQFDIKLQMAGLSGGCQEVIARGELESRKF